MTKHDKGLGRAQKLCLALSTAFLLVHIYFRARTIPTVGTLSKCTAVKVRSHKCEHILQLYMYTAS